MGKKKSGGKKKAGATASSSKNSKNKDESNASNGNGEEKMTAEDMLYQQSMEARVEGLKERCEQLREENSKLKDNATKNEKDTHEFVAYFQNEIEKKDQLIAKLTEQLQRQETDFEADKKTMQDKCDQQVSDAENELEQVKGKLESKVKVLGDELAVLTEYKHKRDLLHSRLEQAEKALKDQDQAHKVALNDMERQFIEKHAKLQRDMEKKIEIIKKQAREDAQEGLDADTRKIIADNKRMGEELKFQLQTSDELQQQGRLLLEENKRLKRNLSLANEKEHEYASRGYYKENELNNAKQKIKSLERTLSQTIRDFEKSKKQVEQNHRKTLENLELEVSGLKQLVKLKNKELKNIRQLSQVILDQRTEVEQYFLEALEQVKKEIRKRRDEQTKQNALDFRKQLRTAQKSNAPVKFPQITNSNNNNNQEEPNTPGDRQEPFLNNNKVRIDLHDLSWEDRERVLRLLFAKINSVETTVSHPLFTNQQPDQIIPYRPDSPQQHAVDSDDLQDPHPLLQTHSNYFPGSTNNSFITS